MLGGTNASIPVDYAYDELFNSSSYGHRLYNETYNFPKNINDYQWVVIKCNRHDSWGYDVRVFPVTMMNTLGNIQINSSDSGTNIYMTIRIDLDTNQIIVSGGNWMTVENIYGIK